MSRSVSVAVSPAALGDVFVRRKAYDRRVKRSADKARLAATQRLQGVVRRAHLRLGEGRAASAASRLQGVLRAVDARARLRARAAAGGVLAARARAALQQRRLVWALGAGGGEEEEDFMEGDMMAFFDAPKDLVRG